MKEILTIEDFWEFPDDQQIHEIIEGAHFVSKAPSVLHQRVSRNIEIHIAQNLTSGEMLHSPIGVFLGNENGIMPDIVVIAKDNSEIVKEKGIYGPPDWIIEIMSPGNRRNDLITKKNLYLQYGVKEYWCVDTEVDQIHMFTIDDKKYNEEIVKLSDQAECVSHVFKIAFNLHDLFSS